MGAQHTAHRLSGKHSRRAVQSRSLSKPMLLGLLLPCDAAQSRYLRCHVLLSGAHRQLGCLPGQAPHVGVVLSFVLGGLVLLGLPLLLILLLVILRLVLLRVCRRKIVLHTGSGMLRLSQLQIHIPTVFKPAPLAVPGKPLPGDQAGREPSCGAWPEAAGQCPAHGADRWAGRSAVQIGP